MNTSIPSGTVLAVLWCGALVVTVSDQQQRIKLVEKGQSFRLSL